MPLREVKSNRDVKPLNKGEKRDLFGFSQRGALDFSKTDLGALRDVRSRSPVSMSADDLAHTVEIRASDAGWKGRMATTSHEAGRLRHLEGTKKAPPSLQPDLVNVMANLQAEARVVQSGSFSAFRPMASPLLPSPVPMASPIPLASPTPTSEGACSVLPQGSAVEFAPSTHASEASSEPSGADSDDGGPPESSSSADAESYVSDTRTASRVSAFSSLPSLSTYRNHTSQANAQGCSGRQLNPMASEPYLQKISAKESLKSLSQASLSRGGFSKANTSADAQTIRWLSGRGGWTGSDLSQSISAGNSMQADRTDLGGFDLAELQYHAEGIFGADDAVRVSPRLAHLPPQPFQ